MVPRRALLALILLTLMAHPRAYGQETTPLALTITLFNDGTAKVAYLLEADPTEARVTVGLLGPPYTNLVVRDEEGNPLAYSVEGHNATIDSLGAIELNIQYLTSSLTAKYGTLWEMNLTSPAETRVVLPLGASVVDFHPLPSTIGVQEGKTYMEFQPGNLSLYYVVGLPDIALTAGEAIEEAENYIANSSLAGYNLEAARLQLEEAKSLYAEGAYLEAKTRAEQALTTAEETVRDAEAAESALEMARRAINEARSSRRTVNLDAAESAYSNALGLYNQHQYSEALNAANQAYQLALLAEPEEDGGLPPYLWLLLPAGIAGAYYFLILRKKVGGEKAGDHSREERVVDLDRILFEHQIRLEEREVLRFIAESGGEAFTSEIRAHFELPRSTAWRMIRRLKEAGILEEVKVGNQSLLRVSPRYLKPG